MCRPQECERDRGACQTLSGDAGRSLSGMAGVAPSTPAGVATRVSQERRSQSRGLLATCQSLLSRSRAGGPAAASACSPLGLVLADSPERHGFCSLSIAETEKPRQDTLGCGWGEATDAFLSERETHGYTPPSHTLRHHSGPVPLAVGKGRPPLEHEGAQVETHQKCLAYPPWAFGRGAWQIGVPIVGAHAGMA
jgi:hypothetical protein